MKRNQDDSKKLGFLASTKAKVVAVGSTAVIGATNVLAAPIVVDTTDTLANMLIGFTAILGVAVVAYGYANIGALFGAKKA
jgi:hypothetical protein